MLEVHVDFDGIAGPLPDCGQAQEQSHHGQCHDAPQCRANAKYRQIPRWASYQTQFPATESYTLPCRKRVPRLQTSRTRLNLTDG